MPRKRKTEILSAEIVPTDEAKLGHLRFVQAYLKGGSATAAARAAGYSESYASEILNLPAIQRELAIARERLISVTTLDATAYLRQLQRLAHVAEQEGQMQAAAAFVGMMGKTLGHLQDKPSEKPACDLRAAITPRQRLALGLPVLNPFEE
jgi:hypothetical protein